MIYDAMPKFEEIESEIQDLTDKIHLDKLRVARE